MCKNRLINAIAISLLAGLIPTQQVKAQVIQFTRIADLNPVNPMNASWGGIDDNGGIGFQMSAPFVGGVYKDIGNGIEKVVDHNTLVPGSSQTFAEIGSLSSGFNSIQIDNGNVAFASGSVPLLGSNTGIYAEVDGALTTLVDTNTAIPDGSGNFTLLQPQGFFGFDDGDIAFTGLGSSGQEGIYRTVNGVLETVADLNTIAPDNPNGAFFGNFGGGSTGPSASRGPILDGEDVIFIGESPASPPISNIRGIYRESGGVLTTVVDSQNLIPNGSSNFGSFNTVAADEGNVAFSAFGGSSAGVYKDIGNGITLVANQSTTVPDGDGFLGVSSGTPVSISGDSIAFVAESNTTGRGGIYTDLGGSLIKVIDGGDLLDGRPLDDRGGSFSFPTFSREAMNGNSIVFSVSFDDANERAVYRADITGISQEFPILPNPDDLCDTIAPPILVRCFRFNDVPSGNWFDPPMAMGYEYVMASDSLFTEILNFPTGIDGDGLFSVFTNGTFLGEFGVGESVNFVDLLGMGVSQFKILGIDPAVDENDPEAFPIQLAFSTERASFEMRAITEESTSVPESSSPLSLLAIGIGGAALTLKRKLKTSKSSEKQTEKIS